MNIRSVFEPTHKEAACLAAIRRRESGGSYNILCGGGHFKDYSHFPRWSGHNGSRAAGAYQMQPNTFRLAATHTGVTDFSPIAQDICALWLLRKYGPNAKITWEASGPYDDPRDFA